MNEKEAFSRRKFVTGTMAVAGGFLLGQTPGRAETPKDIPMNIDSLKKACKGTVTPTGDPDFEKAALNKLWNHIVPDRRPSIIVRVTDEQDVIAAINFARENKLKVVVRGGGHNWCQPTLRNGGLLIDLTDLNKVISIDADARRAVLQPIISNREAQKALNAKGLAYPTGHCPQVKLSGYLLGGGMAWNQGSWGSGTESVEAIELVTAQGEHITASETENPDYFWAARGSGYGFFGVVTRYHLKLYPLPKAILGGTYYYSMEDAGAVGDWMGNMARNISPSVELSLVFLEAPADLKEQAAAHGGKICMMSGVAFEDTPEAAKAALQPLGGCPVKHLSSILETPFDFEQLFDLSGGLFPEGVRARVEATFSNSGPGDLARTIGGHMEKAPSPTGLIFFSVFTGPNVPPVHKDMAYSMSSKVYGGPWTMWWNAADDQANTDWHQECIRLLRPHNIGYYIGETNTVERPATAVEAFTPGNWQRLANLRDKYDPDGVFYGYFDGLV